MNHFTLIILLTFMAYMAGCNKKEDDIMPDPPQIESLLKVVMANGDTIYVSPVNNHPPNGVGWGGFGDIAALKDIKTVAAANSDYNGEANTTKIVDQLKSNGGTLYAAKLCADLEAYGFDDWYLPAAGELNAIYQQLGPNGSGQISVGWWLSSSEYNFYYPWAHEFESGKQYGDLFGPSKLLKVQCRCIRR